MDDILEQLKYPKVPLLLGFLAFLKPYFAGVLSIVSRLIELVA